MFFDKGFPANPVQEDIGDRSKQGTGLVARDFFNFVFSIFFFVVTGVGWARVCHVLIRGKGCGFLLVFEEKKFFFFF